MSATSDHISYANSYAKMFTNKMSLFEATKLFKQEYTKIDGQYFPEHDEKDASSNTSASCKIDQQNSPKKDNKEVQRNTLTSHYYRENLSPNLKIIFNLALAPSFVGRSQGKTETTTNKTFCSNLVQNNQKLDSAAMKFALKGIPAIVCPASKAIAELTQAIYQAIAEKKISLPASKFLPLSPRFFVKRADELERKLIEYKVVADLESEIENLLQDIGDNLNDIDQTYSDTNLRTKNHHMTKAVKIAQQLNQLPQVRVGYIDSSYNTNNSTTVVCDKLQKFYNQIAQKAGEIIGKDIKDFKTVQQKEQKYLKPLQTEYNKAVSIKSQFRTLTEESARIPVYEDALAVYQLAWVFKQATAYHGTGIFKKRDFKLPANEKNELETEIKELRSLAYGLLQYSSNLDKVHNFYMQVKNFHVRMSVQAKPNAGTCNSETKRLLTEKILPKLQGIQEPQKLIKHYQNLNSNNSQNTLNNC